MRAIARPPRRVMTKSQAEVRVRGLRPPKTNELMTAKPIDPVDIDYTGMEEGVRVRSPAGRIARCPCGRLGLGLVYANRRGRYDVSFWHAAVKDYAGAPPLKLDGCDFRSRSPRDLPKAAREMLP